MRAGYPLAELHRHLDGSVRLETILDLGRKHNLPLPAWDVEGLRPYVQVMTPQPGVMAFIAKFEWMRRILVDYDACRRVAYENVEDAYRQGIDYVELRFSPLFMAEMHDLDPVGVVRAVCEGVDQGMRDFPIRVKLIGILSRHYGPELCWKELQAILQGRDEKVVAVDLAGDEANYPGTLFVEHFRKVRETGLHVTIHAGEAAGPESIRQAVLELGAERIGHATAAPQDPSVLELLIERRIGVEVCLTSNVQTSVVPSYREHPLPLFLAKGILATLNTDDPGISAIDIEHEYQVAQEEMNLSPAQVRRLQENALKVAFISEEERAEFLEGLDRNLER